MIPVVTPEQMAAVDAAAPEPTNVLIERAGAAVARAALDMMGGRYGRRVTVLAGKGNNGADGRAAARRLRRVGVRVRVVAAGRDTPDTLGPADIYIDAAFGTGLSRPWKAPRRARPEAPVLAVDIPSGLSGSDGSVIGGPVWRADRTVTFAALKPGLLLGDGPEMCGDVTVADIGLSVEGAFDSAPRCELIGDDDIEPLPSGCGTTHKWQAGLLAVCGSPGMGGAAELVCAAAARSGARIVHLCAPPGVSAPVEAVRVWPQQVVDARRFRACAVGPGLGVSPEAQKRLAEALDLHLPTVVDADALRLMRGPELLHTLGRRRELSAPIVLTPHDGELRPLLGAGSGNRIDMARALARDYRTVALLKGGPTIVSNPDGQVVIVNSGSARLAAAGTGDVLTGMIAGRLCALGGPALLRAAEAAHLHGRAAAAVPGRRLVAGDLVDALRTVTP